MTIKKSIKDGKLKIVETKHLTAQWVKLDFVLYDDGFKAMRDKMSERFNRCFACDWPFQLNKEKMSLAHFDCGVGNQPLCRDCAIELSHKGDK